MTTMMTIGKINVTPNRAMATRATLRMFSADLSVEEKEAQHQLQKIETFKKFKQQSFLPTTMTDVMGLPDLGKELKNVAELAVFNGMPTEHANRTVQIGPKPLKTLQSGDSQMHQWEIKWDAKPTWSNPLMGWTSGADPLSNLTLTFNDVDSAVNFAQKNGWKYSVAAATSKYVVQPGTFNYSQNFLPKKTMERVREQGIKKNIVFKNSAYGASHWFPPIKYDGVGLVEQHGPMKEKA